MSVAGHLLRGLLGAVADIVCALFSRHGTPLILMTGADRRAAFKALRRFNAWQHPAAEHDIYTDELDIPSSYDC